MVILVQYASLRLHGPWVRSCVTQMSGTVPFLRMGSSPRPSMM